MVYSRLFALLTVDGTAMGETALTEEELSNPVAVVASIATAERTGDWDKNTEFTDVTENDAIQEIIYGE